MQFTAKYKMYLFLARFLQNLFIHAINIPVIVKLITFVKYNKNFRNVKPNGNEKNCNVKP
jgi:hypothetical protein